MPRLCMAHRRSERDERAAGGGKAEPAVFVLYILVCILHLKVLYTEKRQVHCVKLSGIR